MVANISSRFAAGSIRLSFANSSTQLQLDNCQSVDRELAGAVLDDLASFPDRRS